MKKVNASNSSFVGMSYFVSHPKLWIAPLLVMILVTFILALVAFFIIFYIWPLTPVLSTASSWFHYAWKILFAFGVAFLAILLFWLFLFPICMNFAFQGVIRSVFRNLDAPLNEEGLLSANVSSFYTFYMTIGWRAFWPLITFISLFIFPPISSLFAQLGIGHISTLDGCDLSMSLLGVPGKKRLGILRQHHKEIFLGGMIAGVMSFLLLPTFLLWLFYIPGIFVGAALLVIQWGVVERQERKTCCK
jgi:hypothetical protein